MCEKFIFVKDFCTRVPCKKLDVDEKKNILRNLFTYGVPRKQYTWLYVFFVFVLRLKAVISGENSRGVDFGMIRISDRLHGH